MCNVLHQVNWQSVCVLCWDAQERFPCSDARGCILESLKNWGWWCRSDITLSSIPIPCLVRCPIWHWHGRLCSGWIWYVWQVFTRHWHGRLVSGLNLICLTSVHMFVSYSVSVSCFIDITFQIFIFNIIRLIYLRYNRAVIKGRSRILNRKCLT